MLRPIAIAESRPNSLGVQFCQTTSRKWILAFLGLLAATFAFKLLLIVGMGFELSFDEAYYWHWAQKLDWCYFSKGPGIALLIRATTQIFGDTELGIRSGALACSTATLIILFLWSCSMFQCNKTAFVAATLAAAAPIMLGTGVLTTIDSPLLLCWTAALAATWFAQQSRSTPMWILVGLALAVGVQFKFTILLFIPSILLIALRQPPSVSRFAGPVLAIAITALSLVPILLWNATHDWITFFHTVDKASTGTETHLFNPQHIFPSIAQQLGVISPVLCVGLFVALAGLVRDSFARPSDRDDRLDSSTSWFLLAMALPIFLFYSVLALHRMIEPNWLAAAYLPLFPAAAFYWLRPFSKLQRYTLASAILVGFAIQAMIFATLPLYSPAVAAKVFSPATGIKPKFDITNRLRGWKDMAIEVERERQRIQDALQRPVFILADHYSFAAWIGFYTRNQDRVFVLPSPRPHNQFDFWATQGRLPPHDASAILVYDLNRSGRDGSHLFQDFRLINKTVPIHRGSVLIRTIRLDLGHHFQEDIWRQHSSPNRTTPAQPQTANSNEGSPQPLFSQR